MRSHLVLLVTSLLTLLGPAHAAGDPVAALLAAERAPAGVVFEIVSGDGNALATTLPRVEAATQKLRARFPGLPVVVVSHGSEQFALLDERAAEQPEVHARVRSLVAADVPVQVCGTHAEWRGKRPEDFPDYVDVVAAGPASINDYRALGYALIVLP